MTAAQIDALLSAPSIAVLCTAGADLRPHGAPVWFEHEGDEIRILIDGSSRKARNIAANPQVSLVVDTREPPYRGVIIGGTARLNGPDPALRRRLASRYLGENVGRAYIERTATMDETDRCVTIRITTRFSWDYSTSKREE
jgi:PPOX class probable F420-dependent enzyme